MTILAILILIAIIGGYIWLARRIKATVPKVVNPTVPEPKMQES